MVEEDTTDPEACASRSREESAIEETLAGLATRRAAEETEDETEEASAATGLEVHASPSREATATTATLAGLAMTELQAAEEAGEATRSDLVACASASNEESASVETLAGSPTNNNKDQRMGTECVLQCILVSVV